MDACSETAERSLIVGLPGLLERGDRNGRITGILTYMGAKNYKTLEVYYPSIELRGEEIICKFDVDATAREIEKQVSDYFAANPCVSGYRVSFVSSSMGTAFLARFLTKTNLDFSVGTMVQISPFVKIHPNTRTFVERITELKGDLPFQTEQDEQRGIRRVIPHEYINNVLNVDALSDVEKFSARFRPDKCMTLYGMNDDRADPRTTEEFHKQIGGDASELFGFETKHCIPDAGNELAKKFLETTLAS